MSSIDTAIQVLKNDGFTKEALKLQHLSGQMNSSISSDALEAAKELQGLFTVRSYGDLAISSMNGWEWNALLEKALKVTCKRIEMLIKSVSKFE